MVVGGFHLEPENAGSVVCHYAIQSRFF
jgi:hypothetical protein